LEIKQEMNGFTKKPKISIVISILQSDVAFLKNTLDSLLGQIYENFEIRFVFSSAITGAITEVSNQISDSRLVKSESVSQSLNAAMSAISGDFAIFIKSGSTLTRDALFQLVRALNKTQDIDIIYSDEERISKDGKRDPFFKPDWSPDLFLSFDYISNFYAVRAKIFREVGGFREELDIVTHYDLLLRLTEITQKIAHIPTILVSIPINDITSSLSKIESFGKRAISEVLARRGIKGEVANGMIQGTFRIKHFLEKEPKVSIIIPTKDQKNLLSRCITALEKRTNYKNFEIIIVDNNSQKEETISYLKSLPYTVIKYESPFNFSRINNVAVASATGDYVLFLNDDAAPLQPDWLSEMVSVCQQADVGVVGAKLVLASNVIQHAGLVLLKTGAGFHPFAGMDANKPGYFGFLNTTRNYSAVTGACLLVKKNLFKQVGGFDETLDLYYQDADLCLKVINEGYRVVYTPYALLLHQGSSTIKEQTRTFFAVENHRHFFKKWPKLKSGDPFYNPNLGWNYRISV